MQIALSITSDVLLIAALRALSALWWTLEENSSCFLDLNQRFCLLDPTTLSMLLTGMAHPQGCGMIAGQVRGGIRGQREGAWRVQGAYRGGTGELQVGGIKRILRLYVYIAWLREAPASRWSHV